MYKSPQPSHTIRRNIFTQLQLVLLYYAPLARSFVLRYALGSSRSHFNCWSTWSCKR